MVLPDNFAIFSLAGPVNRSGLSISCTLMKSRISGKWDGKTNNSNWILSERRYEIGILNDIERIVRFYNAITTIKIVPLNFFNSSISGDVLTPGIYMPQLFSCVSKLLLHGRSDHFGCDTIFSIIAANCFSIRNDDGKHSQNEVGKIISFQEIYRLANLSSPPSSVLPSPLDYP